MTQLHTFISVCMESAFFIAVYDGDIFLEKRSWIMGTAERMQY